MDVVVVEGPMLAGRNLRYVLTVLLADRGPMTTGQLVAAVHASGFRIAGRNSKSVSDALRWEVGRGRVVRLGRARYGPGAMPKQTASWIWQRVRSLSVPVPSPSITAPWPID